MAMGMCPNLAFNTLWYFHEVFGGLGGFYHLFLDGPPLEAADRFSDFTEASFPGYTPLPIALNPVPTIQYPPLRDHYALWLAWVLTADQSPAQNVKGYVLSVDLGDGIQHCWFGELFPSPIAAYRRHQQIAFIARFGLSHVQPFSLQVVAP